jgi:NADH-quinone oxidoreductase subunit E
MSTRKPASKNIQPSSFEFTEENLQLAKKQIAKYPSDRARSAVKSLLFLAQDQHGGWIPTAAMDYIASMLGMSYISVYEVATFYTMFNLNPVGTFHIQLCGTTPCWLRGSNDLKKVCKQKLNIAVGETTDDGLFTLSEVECLGACANAPMVQINDDYYEDLSEENFSELLDNLASGKLVRVGSQVGRKCSEPV